MSLEMMRVTCGSISHAVIEDNEKCCLVQFLAYYARVETRTL